MSPVELSEALSRHPLEQNDSSHQRRRAVISETERCARNASLPFASLAVKGLNKTGNAAI